MDILAPRANGRRARQGITLVEVLLSMVLLTVGVFGLLSVFANSIDQMGRARRQTLVAAYAQRRVDSLAALPCATLATFPSGARRTFETLSDTWTVTGSTDAPTITVSITTPDATSPVVYSTVVPCR
jgi:Tfp pilus assembly protein PilV